MAWEIKSTTSSLARGGPISSKLPVDTIDPIADLEVFNSVRSFVSLLGFLPTVLEVGQRLVLRESVECHRHGHEPGRMFVSSGAAIEFDVHILYDLVREDVLSIVSPCLGHLTASHP